MTSLITRTTMMTTKITITRTPPPPTTTKLYHLSLRHMDSSASIISLTSDTLYRSRGYTCAAEDNNDVFAADITTTIQSLY